MRVKRSLILYYIAEIFLCIGVTFITLFLCSSINVTTCEFYLGVFALINLGMFLWYNNKTQHELFSIAVLFVIFLYLFNLGIPISRVFGWIGTSEEIFLQRRVYSMGEENFIHFSTYVFLLISFLQIGLLYYYSRKRTSEDVTDKQISEYRYEIKLKGCLKVGWILLLVGIIPYTYAEYNTLKYSIIYGYQNSANIFSLSGTGIGLIGGLVQVGFMMLLFGYQNKKWKFNMMFMILVAYQLIRMYITGDRSTGIILILVWMLIRHKFVTPIKGKRAIIYFLVIYGMLLFIKMIELTRSISKPEVGGIFQELLQSNMFAETIIEYGGNIWSGLMVYYSVPATGAFRLGTTYLAALVGKPLQILDITSAVWEYANFSYFLQEPARGVLVNNLTTAMGGSFSGEWYFNFGWVGIILIPFFGYVLGKFSDACVKKEHNPVLSAFLMYVATLVIWWVRQYFTSVSWNTLFYGVVVLVVYLMFCTKSKYNRMNINENNMTRCLMENKIIKDKVKD